MTIIYVFISVYSYVGVLKQLKGHVKQTAIGVSLIKGKKKIMIKVIMMIIVVSKINGSNYNDNFKKSYFLFYFILRCKE